MKKLWLAMLLVVPVAFALTDTKADLIQLDKDWGKANLKADRAALEKVYADDVISVGPDGIFEGKSQMLEGLEPSADTNYVVTDYKVKMIGSDTAVMVHSAGSGDTAHRSLHVFTKQGGKWTVAATATIPGAASPASN